MKARLVLAVLVPGFVAAAQVVAQQATVVVGGTLIDGTGGPPVRDAVVVISGRKISAVGPRGQVQVPAGAHEISAAGKYIVPGLMDANVHLVLSKDIEFIVRYEGRYEDLMEEAAQVTLKQGLTTIFDSWGPLQPLLNVRDRIKRGQTVGSRLYIAGNIVGLSGPFGRDFNGPAESSVTRAMVKRTNLLWEENTGPDLLWMTPEQVRAEMRKYTARGMDFIKYAVSGHGSSQGNFLMFSPEAQRAIVEETHRAGMTVQTHTTTVESLREAIEAGVEMMQHCTMTGPTPIPESTIKLMLDKRVYCAVQPRTQQRMQLDLVQAETALPSQHAKERIQVQHGNEVRLIKAGVPVLLATDGGTIDPDFLDAMSPKARIDRLTEFGEGHFVWFQAMAEKGMTPMAEILAATRNIAAAYHKLDEFGTVERGKLADLVILDADPLQDIQNMRKITLVMKDGQVVDRDRLPINKVLTAPSAVVSPRNPKTR